MDRYRADGALNSLFLFCAEVTNDTMLDGERYCRNYPNIERWIYVDRIEAALQEYNSVQTCGSRTSTADALASLAGAIVHVSLWSCINKTLQTIRSYNTPIAQSIQLYTLISHPKLKPWFAWAVTMLLETRLYKWSTPKLTTYNSLIEHIVFTRVRQ